MTCPNSPGPTSRRRQDADPTPAHDPEVLGVEQQQRQQRMPQRQLEAGPVGGQQRHRDQVQKDDVADRAVSAARLERHPVEVHAVDEQHCAEQQQPASPQAPPDPTAHQRCADVGAARRAEPSQHVPGRTNIQHDHSERDHDRHNTEQPHVSDTVRKGHELGPGRPQQSEVAHRKLLKAPHRGIGRECTRGSWTNSNSTSTTGAMASLGSLRSMWCCTARNAATRKISEVGKAGSRTTAARTAPASAAAALTPAAENHPPAGFDPGPPPASPDSAPTGASDSDRGPGNRRVSDVGEGCGGSGASVGAVSGPPMPTPAPLGSSIGVSPHGSGTGTAGGSGIPPGGPGSVGPGTVGPGPVGTGRPGGGEVGSGAVGSGAVGSPGVGSCGGATGGTEKPAGSAWTDTAAAPTLPAASVARTLKV